MSSQLDLPAAIGRLITGKVDGTALSADRERAITDGIMSGVTLFKENADSVGQLFELVQEMRKLGGEEFLIAVDQEGGAVQRFDEVLTPLPSAMALAALDDDEWVRKVASHCAQELAALGVNCNLTPVLDVNSNRCNPIIGTRSFGDDPERVAALGQIVASAHMNLGVLPTAKHFPGHGDTYEDSHLALAIARGDRAQLWQRELKPFVSTAPQMPAMLIGHVHLPAFDKEPLPASLSPAITQQLLRGEIGFDGFLLTDDLPVMKAIVDNYGLEDASIMAINAGADNLLVSGTADQVASVHAALLKAVHDGTIAEDRLYQAITRRQVALASAANAASVRRKPALDRLHQLIAIGEELTEYASGRAVSIVRGLLPYIQLHFSPPWVIVVPDHPRYRLDLLSALTEILPGGSVSLHEKRYSLNPSDEEIAQVCTFATGKNCILLTYRALLNPGQLELAAKLVHQVAQGVLISTDVPYDLTELPQWPNAAATFDPSANAMQGLAKVLTGRVSAAGVSPVEL
jgi:beta-N-acetylhexosaminidase